MLLFMNSYFRKVGGYVFQRNEIHCCRRFFSSSSSSTPLSFCEKSLNSKMNFKREKWISDTINTMFNPSKLPTTTDSTLLSNLKKYLYELNHQQPFTNVECVQKGGRRNNYDFHITFQNMGSAKKSVFRVEFKFNAKTIEETPQFVSPVNPSQYLSSSYEEYFYKEFLPELSEFGKFPIPDKKTYLSQIGNPNPNCMKEQQTLYYKGCKNSIHYTGEMHAVQFYNKCKDISKKSIHAFLSQLDVVLDIKQLSAYLQKSQRNKTYMLYFNDDFNLYRGNSLDYILTDCKKNLKKSRFECLSSGGKTLSVLLRWKNGNGIAFPCFQISILP